MEALIRRCGGMVNKRHIREQVKMLAEVGLIKRIVITKDKNGNPLYTVPGRAPRFELPRCRPHRTAGAVLVKAAPYRLL
ncbi:MAG TPA: hypothetical protein H9881_17965 [Candidatus Stackebrandtia excrementipullorum]|nr:hypothetical protein [Candidatus Stackebrandtia excrementipullorum]